MKLTRRQLRRLIKEAMWNPDGAVKSAVEISGVDTGQLQKIAKLSMHDKEQAASLFDAITDYNPDTPLSTGSSLEDIKNFNKEMITSKGIADWRGYYDNLADDEKAAFDILLDPAMNPKMFVYEEEDHDDFDWDEEGFVDEETPRSRPDRYYLYSIETPNYHLRNAVNKLRNPWPNDGYGVDTDQDAIFYLLGRAAGLGEIDQETQVGNHELRNAGAALLVWLMNKLPDMEVEVIH